jgi:hypothetical protein
MVADGLLTRERSREARPRVEYELTARSDQLLPVLSALARWGYDWAWTAPQESEAIDIGAILRVAPGLVHPPAGMSGVAEFTVHVDVMASFATRVVTVTTYYALTVQGGAVTVAERQAADADVRVVGWEGGWVAALGPCGDFSGLQIEGDERLASVLLVGVGPGAGRGIPVA